MLKRGISLTQFYEYSKCFKQQDFERLRIHKTPSQTTLPKVEKRILELVINSPQKKGGHIEQLLKLGEEHLKQGKQLSEEQIKSIEKANPCFKEVMWKTRFRLPALSRHPLCGQTQGGG